MNEVICKPFERTDGRFTLKDAICLSQEEWAVTTPEAEIAMQEARWASWLAGVTAASDNVAVEAQ